MINAMELYIPSVRRLRSCSGIAVWGPSLQMGSYFLVGETITPR